MIIELYFEVTKFRNTNHLVSNKDVDAFIMTTYQLDFPLWLEVTIEVR